MGVCATATELGFSPGRTPRDSHLSWRPAATSQQHCRPSCWQLYCNRTAKSTLRLQRKLVPQRGVCCRAGEASQEGRPRPSTSGRHCLACGQQLELISFTASNGSTDKPPLLFLHGALHGAWCYAENFLPYFASKGNDAHAMSLRAHGESDFVPGQTGSFADHVDDIASVIRSLPRPPVLIAHSLGGVVAQRYLVELAKGVADRPPLAGIGFVATPAVPAALGPSLGWFKQLKSLLHGFQIMWWMMAMPKSRKKLVHKLFFSPDLPDAQLDRYHANMMGARSLLPVECRELTEFKEVLEEVAAELKTAPVPVFVMCAGEDRLIMPCQVEALGDLLGVPTVSAPNVAHDLMLDTRWQVAADLLDDWMCGLGDQNAAAVPASA